MPQQLLSLKMSNMRKTLLVTLAKMAIQTTLSTEGVFTDAPTAQIQPPSQQSTGPASQGFQLSMDILLQPFPFPRSPPYPVLC